MNISAFSLCTNKKIIFKAGSIIELSTEILFYGNNTVIFAGGASLENSGKLKSILNALKDEKISFSVYRIANEPSPKLVDEITAELRGKDIQSIVAVGGGSVIDTAKAVSAMLCEKGSICDFLEGIGDRQPSGRKIPLIAVPTTAGTGSEATYNAVLSRVGEQGFKKSLRHKNYTPDIAIIDPGLYSGCPPHISASSGLDALSQLIEAYISTKSFFYTDILVVGAIEAVFEALPIISADRETENFCNEVYEEAWHKMAYGSLISGMALANNGLAIVHGIAGPLGGFFHAPHGTLCGTLFAAGLKATIEKLEKYDPDSPALLKFSKLGYIFLKSDDMLPKEARSRFIQIIETMTENLGIPRLTDFGVTEKDLEKIAEASSNKNNPITFNKDEIIEILRSRL